MCEDVWCVCVCEISPFFHRYSVRIVKDEGGITVVVKCIQKVKS